MQRPLLVGQAPSRLHGHIRAFDGDSGERLRKLFRIEDLDSIFESINLLDDYPGKKGKGDAFDVRLAAKRARVLRGLAMVGLTPATVLFAGKNVARAFGEPAREWFEWFPFGAARAAVIPHPSGVNRWYNSSSNRTIARVFFSEVW